MTTLQQALARFEQFKAAAALIGVDVGVRFFRLISIVDMVH